MLATQLIPHRRLGATSFALPRHFDDLWAGFESPPATAPRTGPSRPRMDLAETVEAYHLSAELPGASEADIEVSVADGVLSVVAEKRAAADSDEARYHVRERSYGRLERRFRLPETADAEAIHASFENGLLEVTVPKRAEAKPDVKRIAIETA
jgi:HSP20 family protein